MDSGVEMEGRVGIKGIGLEGRVEVEINVGSLLGGLIPIQPSTCISDIALTGIDLSNTTSSYLLAYFLEFPFKKESITASSVKL